MEFKTMRCPSCNGTLEVDDGLDTFFCKYCGSKLILDGQSGELLNAKVRIKEMEHEERMQDKKHANERERWERKQQAKKLNIVKDISNFVIPISLCIGIPFILLIFGNIGIKSDIKTLEKIEIEVQENIKAGDYDMALINANRLRLDNNWSSDTTKSWDTRRETLIELINDRKREADLNNPNNIVIPKTSGEIEKMKGEEAEEFFQMLGFTRITMKEKSGSAGLFSTKNKVDQIIVSGKSEFEKDSIFSKDSEIVIYYYEK